MPNNFTFFKKKSKKIRNIILETALNAGKGHVPPALSWVELGVYFFYSKTFDFLSNLKNKDKFILSKGHGCLTIYSILYDLKFIKKKDIEKFSGEGSLLPGHPDTKINKIENCSGSLGHGVAVGCGKALALKYKNTTKKVVVLLGDGECQEGSVWESFIFASQNNLDNLVVIIDYNKLGATDFINNTGNLSPLKKKIVSFGFDVLEVNGHSFNDINKKFKIINKKNKKPKCIIANTIKGRGISFMENSKNWHHQLPKDEQIKLAKKELL